MTRHNKTNFERDDDSFPADAYKVRYYDGIAFAVLGWETAPDEDTHWTGMEVRTGRVLCVMIGDDRKHSVEPEDLSPLDPKAFCRSCGQIGCGCNVYE